MVGVRECAHRGDSIRLHPNESKQTKVEIDSFKKVVDNKEKGARPDGDDQPN
jgi:hypothetical protein